jgi:hypothetical protein
MDEARPRIGRDRSIKSEGKGSETGVRNGWRDAKEMRESMRWVS